MQLDLFSKGSLVKSQFKKIVRTSKLKAFKAAPYKEILTTNASRRYSGWWRMITGENQESPTKCNGNESAPVTRKVYTKMNVLTSKYIVLKRLY